MAWLKSAVVAEPITTPAVQQTEVPVARPISMERELAEEEEKEYKRLVAELGAHAGLADICWHPLDEYLSKRGMGYYDINHVLKFLQEQAPMISGWNAEMVKATVSWEPLREKDTWEEYFGSGQHAPHSIYSKKVPIQALQLVSDIEKAAPGEYSFYVSDYAAPRPDPFLAVGHKSTRERRVIFHWDEPMFKMKDAAKRLRED